MKETVTIKNNYEFRRMYSKGKSAVTPGVVVYFRPNRFGHNRIGVTVSTKVGKAVVRNLVRRRLREICRLNQEKMLQGYDVIVIARVRTPEIPYRKLNGMFLRACGQLGLLKEEKA